MEHLKPRAGGTRLIATGVRVTAPGPKESKIRVMDASCAVEENGLAGKANAFIATTSTGHRVIKELSSAPPTTIWSLSLLDTLVTTSTGQPLNGRSTNSSERG